MAGLGLGPVDAVLVVGEDPAGGSPAREALSLALNSLMTLPLCARGAAPKGVGGAAAAAAAEAGDMPGAGVGARAPGGVGVGGGVEGGAEGGRVLTVIRFLMEGTLEEALEGGGGGMGVLEVRVVACVFFLLLLFPHVVCFVLFWSWSRKGGGS